MLNCLKLELNSKKVLNELSFYMNNQPIHQLFTRSLIHQSTGQVIASVESVKAAGSVYAPGDMEVMAVNTPVTENPALVNENAFEKGFMLQVCTMI